jgi:hypothetical protein
VRWFLVFLFFCGLGTSAHASDAPAPERPDQIIVRRFATPSHVVTLDPSLGFSLEAIGARRAISVLLRDSREPTSRL